jgi:hypothetical protein
MSVACDVCHQYRDHNIMEHIWELESQLEDLTVLVSRQRRENAPEHPTYPTYCSYCYEDDMKVLLLDCTRHK